MEALWDAPAGLSARELADRLPGGSPTLTTVLTVLERLRGKDLVTRSGRRGTGFTYRARSSREEGVVATMIASLTSTGDRQAALVRFIGELDDEDAELLEQALRTREAREGVRGRR